MSKESSLERAQHVLEVAVATEADLRGAVRTSLQRVPADRSDTTRLAALLVDNDSRAELLGRLESYLLSSLVKLNQRRCVFARLSGEHQIFAGAGEDEVAKPSRTVHRRSQGQRDEVVKVELAAVEPEYVSIDFSLDRGYEQEETTTQASSSSSAFRRRRSSAAAGGSVSNSEHTIRVWIETLETDYPYDTTIDLSLSSGSQYNFTGLTPSVNYKISIYEFIESSPQLMINYTFWSHPEKPYNWHADLYYTENYVNDIQDTSVSGPLDPILKLHFWTKFQNPGEGYFLAVVTNLKSYGISKIRSGFEMRLLDENVPCAGLGKGVKEILGAFLVFFNPFPNSVIIRQQLLRGQSYRILRSGRPYKLELNLRSVAHYPRRSSHFKLRSYLPVFG